MLRPILCLIGILVLLLLLSRKSDAIIIREQIPPVTVNRPVQVPVLIEKVTPPGPLIDNVTSMYYSDLEWYAPLYSNKRPLSSNYYNGSYKTYVPT